jgi:hypothetical protein
MFLINNAFVGKIILCLSSNKFVKDVNRSDSGLFIGIISAFAWRGLIKPIKSVFEAG